MRIIGDIKKIFSDNDKTTLEIETRNRLVSKLNNENTDVEVHLYANHRCKNMPKPPLIKLHAGGWYLSIGDYFEQLIFYCPFCGQNLME